MFLEQKYVEQGLNRRTALELVRCSSLFRCSRPWNNILEQELEQRLEQAYFDLPDIYLHD